MFRIWILQFSDAERDHAYIRWLFSLKEVKGILKLRCLLEEMIQHI